MFMSLPRSDRRLQDGPRLEVVLPVVPRSGIVMLDKGWIDKKQRTELSVIGHVGRLRVGIHNAKLSQSPRVALQLRLQAAVVGALERKEGVDVRSL